MPSTQSSHLLSFQNNRCASCRDNCCMLRNVHLPADSYGGNQDWFQECRKDKYSALRGCGIIALLNQFASLAMAYPEAEVLLPEEGLPHTKDEYIDWAYSLRPFLWPGNFGLPKGNTIREGAQAFAKARGVELEWHTIYGRPKLSEEIDFIHSGLAAQVPVAHLVWKNHFDDLTWHWIVITGLETDPADCQNLSADIRARYKGELFVTVSNYGRKEAYPVELLRKVYPFHRELQYPVIKTH